MSGGIVLADRAIAARQFLLPILAARREEKPMHTNDLRHFEQFMQQRDQAARAYVRGDATPLVRIVARMGDATFYAPRGGYIQGADEVFSTYERDATAFAPGGESSFEVLQIGASDGLAYWVGFQRATAHMYGSTEAVEFNLRVTEVFRREGDDWKLVHRHADPLISEAKQHNK
jgi:ketosteroid isomerase-like protein